MAEITIQQGDKFIVTGRYYHSTKHFSMIFDSWHYAKAINLWNGSRWLLRDGKRTLIERVYN
jgi:hypothetical protein